MDGGGWIGNDLNDTLSNKIARGLLSIISPWGMMMAEQFDQHITDENISVQVFSYIIVAK